MSWIESPPAEEWDENGEPLTLAAAAADALEWCRLMRRMARLRKLKFSQLNSADDLSRCIDLLSRQLEEHWSSADKQPPKGGPCKERDDHEND